MGLVDGKRLRKQHLESNMSKRTSHEEEKEFTAFVSTWEEGLPLDVTMEWIAERYEPGDVFSVEVLKRWAEDHGYILGEEIICPMHLS